MALSVYLSACFRIGARSSRLSQVFHRLDERRARKSLLLLVQVRRWLHQHEQEQHLQAHEDNCEKMTDLPRVLSIQSHVVSGYVGNKSATFPLQLLGFEVDAINSVQFSNHTGYKCIKGQVLSDKDLGELVDGLHANNLDNGYTHLLTGYIGSPSFLQQVAEVVKHLKSINPGLIYVCDPVMGDNGAMYVPKDLLPLYQEIIIPLADIITPNQFEVEQLTGCQISSVEDAWRAIDRLHAKGCRTVVLSSSELGADGQLLALASTTVGGGSGGDGTPRRITLDIPKYTAAFTGSGDLFAALFLAWMHKSGGRLETALENTIATLQAVLKRTLAHAHAVGMSAHSVELKLVQSKRDIEQPSVEELNEMVRHS